MKGSVSPKSLLLSVLVFLGSYPSSPGSAVAPPRSDGPFGNARKETPKVISVEIPSYGLIFQQVRVNGSPPLWFAFDTGASFAFVIDAERANSLGIKTQRRITSRGGAGQGSFDIGFGSDALINLGGIQFANQSVALIALHELEPIIGRPLDGLIGRPLLDRFVVEIDYAASRICLYDPATYKYLGKGERLPLEAEGGYLFVPAEITMPGLKPLEGRFLVDTGGAMTTAMLTKAFVESNRILEHTSKTISDRSLTALGGNLDLLVARGTSLRLGSLEIPNPILSFSQHSAGGLAGGFDGLIGGELLRRFTAIFDCARRSLILEPNEHFGERCEYNMSGMIVRSEGKDFRSFRVHTIIRDSPAARAGLRVGDRLLRIDGRDARGYTLEDIYEISRKEGRRMSLRILRGRRVLGFNIRLRRLI